MNAHTTPSRDRRSHSAIAQIWQFGIPRADSLRVRRRALNRRYTGDRRTPKPFGRITQDTRVILAKFFDPICGDDHPCISRSARNRANNQMHGILFDLPHVITDAPQIHARHDGRQETHRTRMPRTPGRRASPGSRYARPARHFQSSRQQRNNHVTPHISGR